MENVLSRVTKADIIRDPYPHVVVKNALDPSLADALLAAYPTPEYLGRGLIGMAKNGKMPNNLKLRYTSADIARDDQIAPIWKEFNAQHLTFDFFKKYLEIFQDDLCALHPQIKDFLDGITAQDIGVQRIDTYANKKLMLNGEICADSPVTEVSSVRSLHVDHPTKLGVALLYLRSKDDDSVGGDFEVYRRTSDAPFVMNHIRNIKEPYRKQFAIVESVPYEHNTLLLFLNSPRSFHGVSPRTITPHVRRLYSVNFDLNFPLFDLSEHAENPWITRSRAWYMKLTGKHKEMV